MSSTEDKILKHLKNGPSKPGILAEVLGLSRQALHKNLKILLQKKQITKSGSTPHIVYQLTLNNSSSRVKRDYTICLEKILPAYKNIFSQSQSLANHLHAYTTKKNKIYVDFGFMLDSSAVYSSNIEGNSLNLNSFLNNKSLPKKHRPREVQEIEDLVEAYRLSQKKPFTEKNMLQAHAIFSQQFLQKARQGVYRKEPVGVFSRNGLEYMAVEPQFVEAEMQELFKLIKNLLKEDHAPIEVIFLASWIHLMIALIHPFSDGNGRAARLCEKWFITKKLGPEFYALQSEELYFKKRPQYYNSLKLGLNYWEADMNKSLKFFKLLPKAIANMIITTS